MLPKSTIAHASLEVLNTYTDYFSGQPSLLLLVAGLLDVKKRSARGARQANARYVATLAIIFEPRISNVQIAKELAGGELSRTMILVVDGKDSAAAVEAGRKFEAALRAEPRVAKGMATLEGGSPEGIEESLWSLYHSKRLGFFAPSAAEVEALTTPNALLEAAAKLAPSNSGVYSKYTFPVA